MKQLSHVSFYIFLSTLVISIISTPLVFLNTNPLAATLVTSSSQDVEGLQFSNFHTFIPFLFENNRQLNINHYKELVFTLSTSFPSRNWNSVNNDLAIEWLQEQLISSTNHKILPFFNDTFIFGSYHNIIGILPAINPTSRTILLTAHFDSVADTPGADDNGSGTCAVIELARLLSNYSLGVNVMCCLFNAEENGLLGSEEFANYLYSSSYAIECVINFDMLLGAASSLRLSTLFDSSIGFEGYYWGGLMRTLSRNYADGIFSLIPSTESTSWAASDHYSFALYDIPSIMIAEQHFTPYYHEPQDVWNVSFYSYIQAYEALITTASLIFYWNEYQQTNSFHLSFEGNETMAYNFIIKETSQVTIRGWNNENPVNGLFKIREENIFTKGVSAKHGNMHIWSKTLDPGQYSVEFCNIVNPTNITLSIGIDANNNQIADFWEESFANLSIAAVDSDKDGLTNLQEYEFNTNPLIADTDNDGVTDSIEIANGGNPNDSNNIPSITSPQTTAYSNFILPAISFCCIVLLRQNRKKNCV